MGMINNYYVGTAAPTDTTVAWVNPDTMELKFWIGGVWKPVFVAPDIIDLQLDFAYDYETEAYSLNITQLSGGVPKVGGLVRVSVIDEGPDSVHLNGLVVTDILHFPMVLQLTDAYSYITGFPVLASSNLSIGTINTVPLCGYADGAGGLVSFDYIGYNPESGKWETYVN